MGIVLMIGLLVGVAVGMAVSVALVVNTVLLTRKQVSRRQHVWRTFGGAMALFLALLWVAVYFYPLPAVRPGSDYDVALKNLFISGFAYAAAPGFAALFAFVVTLALPRQPLPPTPPVS
jgi:hypothetical protein